MTDAPLPKEGYTAWLEKNPAPDLQELVRKFGSYNRITADGWHEYDAAMEDWKRRYRLRNNTRPV
jgi:hypothetical protein